MPKIFVIYNNLIYVRLLCLVENMERKMGGGLKKIEKKYD